MASRMLVTFWSGRPMQATDYGLPASAPRVRRSNIFTTFVTVIALFIVLAIFIDTRWLQYSLDPVSAPRHFTSGDGPQEYQKAPALKINKVSSLRGWRTKRLPLVQVDRTDQAHTLEITSKSRVQAEGDMKLLGSEIIFESRDSWGDMSFMPEIARCGDIEGIELVACSATQHVPAFSHMRYVPAWVSSTWREGTSGIGGHTARLRVSCPPDVEGITSSDVVQEPAAVGMVLKTAGERASAGDRIETESGADADSKAGFLTERPPGFTGAGVGPSTDSDEGASTDVARTRRICSEGIEDIEVDIEVETLSWVAKATIDVVVSHVVPVLVVDLDHLLRSWLRVLRPNGILMFALPLPSLPRPAAASAQAESSGKPHLMRRDTTRGQKSNTARGSQAIMFDDAQGSLVDWRADTEHMLYHLELLRLAMAEREIVLDGAAPGAVAALREAAAKLTEARKNASVDLNCAAQAGLRSTRAVSERSEARHQFDTLLQGLESVQKAVPSELSFAIETAYLARWHDAPLEARVVLRRTGLETTMGDGTEQDTVGAGPGGECEPQFEWPPVRQYS